MKNYLGKFSFVAYTIKKEELLRHQQSSNKLKRLEHYLNKLNY